MVVIKGVVDPLAEPGLYVGPVVVFDRRQEEVFEGSWPAGAGIAGLVRIGAVAIIEIKHLAEDVEDAALQGFALDGQFFKQTVVDGALASLLGDEVPEVADLGLADAVDAPKPLLHTVRVPWEVVVDHQVGALEVDALARGVGRDEHLHVLVGAEECLSLLPFFALCAAVDRDDRVGVANDVADLVTEVVQRVAMLGEDNDLPLPAVGVVHLRRVLEQLREFVPLAVFAGGHESFRLVFEVGEDRDLGFEFGNRLGRRGVVDELLFEFLLLVGGEVVVILGDGRDGFGKHLTATNAEFGIAQPVGEPAAASLERLIDRLGAGGEPPLEGRESEAYGPLSRSLEFVGLTHLGLHVVGDRLVEGGLDVRKRVVDDVRLPLREERRAVELDEFLLDHAAHEVGGVYFVRPVAELAVEAVGVEQRQEELEVLLLAVVRRGGHQEEVAGFAAQPLAQAEAGGLRELRARIVSGEFVGLVEDDQVPAGGEEFFLERAGPLFLAIAA